MRTQFGRPPSISDSVGSEWGPVICVPCEFPGAADAAGLRTIFGEPLIDNDKPCEVLPGKNIGGSEVVCRRVLTQIWGVLEVLSEEMGCKLKPGTRQAGKTWGGMWRLRGGGSMVNRDQRGCSMVGGGGSRSGNARRTGDLIMFIIITFGSRLAVPVSCHW